MKIDLRKRCPRERCNKLIRSKMDQANFQRYGYCSFHCSEWHRVELAAAHLAAKRANSMP